MQILLFGKDNSVTDTIESMLVSVDEWTITRALSFFNIENDLPYQDHNAAYEVIVANLFGFPTSPKKLVREISSKFSEIPLLVLYSYNHDFLIAPLLEMGATGYLQIGSGEENLVEAVKKVSNNHKYIGVVNT